MLCVIQNVLLSSCYLMAWLYDGVSAPPAVLRLFQENGCDI